MLPLNLRNLKQPNTLLLLGGAFGIVALVGWCAWAYRPVFDRTVSAPAEAIAAVSLRMPLSSKVSAALPHDLTASLNGFSAYAVRSASGTVEWRPLNGPGHWRIVSRDVEAVGFAGMGGAKLPFSATFSQNAVALRVGRGFRGLDVDANKGQDRLIRAFPTESSLYISDLNPASSDDMTSSFVSSGGGQTGNLLGELMRELPGRMELMLAQHAGDVLQPFLIVMTPNGRELNMTAIDNTLKRAVGKIDPASLAVELPDHSGSKEIRTSSSAVHVVSKKISTGRVKRFMGPSGKVEIDYFLDANGQLWISDHLEIIQGFVSSGDDSSLNFPLCTTLKDPFTAVVHPKTGSATGTVPEWITNQGKGFDSVVFSLKQAETGLFTLCGYLK